MSEDALVIAAILILGIPYLVLGALAYKHFESPEKSMGAAGPWWPLYSRYYNLKGRKFCWYGKLLLILSAVFSLTVVFV